MGFIYADGFISNRKIGSRQLGISLSVEDFAHLEKFNKSIESNHKINIYKTNSSSYKEDIEYCRVIITDDKVCDDIEKLGVLEHKSLVLSFPSEFQVPLSFRYHFIRGYFDGDGSISITNNKEFAFKLCGTKEMLDEIKNIFGLNHGLDKRNEDTKNSYSLSIGGNRQVEKMLDLLYFDANIYLDRKYARYIQLKEFNANVDEQIKQDKYEQQLKNTLDKEILFEQKREKKNQKKIIVDKEVVSMYLQNISKTKISKILKMSLSAIQNILNEYGYLKIEAESKDVLNNQIITLFQAGNSKSEINRQTGCSRDYIRKILKK